jgi:hypothetical protein
MRACTRRLICPLLPNVNIGYQRNRTERVSENEIEIESLPSKTMGARRSLWRISACENNTGYTYTGGGAQSTGGGCTPAASSAEQRVIIFSQDRIASVVSESRSHKSQ